MGGAECRVWKRKEWKTSKVEKEEYRKWKTRRMQNTAHGKCENEESGI